MADTKHLAQRRQRWFFRRAIPEAIQHRFHDRISTVEVSLATDSLSVAQRRKSIVAPRAQALFDKARAGHRVTANELDELRSAFGRHGALTAAEEAAIELRELNATHEWLADEPLDNPDTLRGSLLWAEHRKAAAVARAAGKIAVAEPIASGSMVEILELDTGEHARALLKEIGVKATPDALKKVQERIARAYGKALALWDRKIAPPPLPGAPARRHAGGKALKMSEASEKYIEWCQRDDKAKLTEQTAKQMRSTYRLFANYTGDGRLDAITREDATGFLDTLGRLDSNYGHKPDAAKLSLAELLRRYPAAGGSGLSNKTLNRHQSALATLYKWARDKGGLLDGSALNPFEGLARPKAKGTEYLPFNADELPKLFNGEKFETEPDTYTFAKARPWIMAVALYGGMRLGEICELDAEDVKRAGKTPFFDVTESKSEAGVRRVPVHSALVALGFLKYVEAIGKGPLFPGVAPKGPDKKRSHTFSSRFPEFRREREVTRDRLAFHSFRKCFVRALELAKVDRDRAALVVGHERGFTFRVYNPEGVDMPALRDVVEAVKYPGLKLARLRP